MFISDSDYKVVIGDTSLNVISQVSTENRTNAELQAQELISSYLRPKYDVNKVFTATGDSRNKLIVMYTCDIALYNMVSSLPNKMGYDIREKRYDRAIKWLQGVQQGSIVPDLPLLTDESGNTTNSFVLGCQKKVNYNW